MTKPTIEIIINPSELKFTFIASPGPGGQNVNKVATAAILRFNVQTSTSLPEPVRQRLITLLGKRLSIEGHLIIKASRYRTQEKNKQDALARLQSLLKQVSIPPKKRKKTRPTLASKKRRLDTKKLTAHKKTLRSRVN